MMVFEEYRALYDELITKSAKLIIMQYNSIHENYTYLPYAHLIHKDAVKELADLIINNMVFYAYSENEIVTLHKQMGVLDDLKVAAQYAYQKRLPQRTQAKTDGTPGEVLLDILIQVYEPVSQKLIARAKFKQLGDNNEIKGYDALYFTKDANGICLWLGQVKTGTQSYCTNNIINDLNTKYLSTYFCKSMFYIAERVDQGSDLIALMNKINKLYFISIKEKWNNDKKIKEVFDLLVGEKITIKIPCVLTFTADIYQDAENFNEKLIDCVKTIKENFEKNIFSITNDIEYEVVFYIFPVRDIDVLRSTIRNFKVGD